MYLRSPSDEPSARVENVGIPAAVLEHPAESGSVLRSQNHANDSNYGA